MTACFDFQGCIRICICICIFQQSCTEAGQRMTACFDFQGCISALISSQTSNAHISLSGGKLVETLLKSERTQQTNPPRKLRWFNKQM